MKPIVWVKLLLTFACLGWLVACTVNPVTGERELSLVSTSQAIAMGQQNYPPGQQSQGGPYYLDSSLQGYVQRVGNQLARVSDVPNLPYEFVVLNNPVPNAWALPGGKIAINRGLMVELEDEAQLAAVLGHEIVHAAANHGASQMSRNMLLQAGMMATGVALSDHEYGNLLMLGTQLGSTAWMASYGRDDELESDHYGMLYMSRAGYDTLAAVELQETFVRLSEGRASDFISGLFASHPPSQARVDQNRQTATRLPQGGERNRDAYQAAISQILRDQPAYEAQQRAIEALNNNQPREAMIQLDQAVAIQPDEGQFWELRGHAWVELEEYGNAETAYGTAIGKNPGYYQHWLARGLLRQERNLPGAEADLEKAQGLLATSTGAFALAQLAEQRNDMDTALGYYRSVAQGSGELAQRAAVRVARHDLPSQPNQYIASGLTSDTQGNLVIQVRNDSPFTLTGIRLQLTGIPLQQSETSMGMAREFDLGRTLEPGELANLPTGLQSARGNYVVSVSSARILE